MLLIFGGHCTSSRRWLLDLSFLPAHDVQVEQSGVGAAQTIVDDLAHGIVGWIRPSFSRGSISDDIEREAGKQARSRLI